MVSWIHPFSCIFTVISPSIAQILERCMPNPGNTVARFDVNDGSRNVGTYGIEHKNAFRKWKINDMKTKWLKHKMAETRWWKQYWKLIKGSHMLMKIPKGLWWYARTIWKQNGETRWRKRWEKGLQTWYRNWFRDWYIDINSKAWFIWFVLIYPWWYGNKMAQTRWLERKL